MERKSRICHLILCSFYFIIYFNPHVHCYTEKGSKNNITHIYIYTDMHTYIQDDKNYSELKPNNRIET